MKRGSGAQKQRTAVSPPALFGCVDYDDPLLSLSCTARSEWGTGFPCEEGELHHWGAGGARSGAAAQHAAVGQLLRMAACGRG
jgi:hypothetical protein